MQRTRLEPGAGNTAASAEVVTDTPAPRKGPLDINTLKYAFIDPKTHVVTFVGAYDPAYATGPIPYSDLLVDALDNAYPSISLKPNAQDQQAQINQMDQLVSADISRMGDPNYCNQWAQKLMQLLLYDNSIQADSKRFFANCAAAMGITGDELKRLYDGAAGKIDVPGTEVMQLASKLMRGIGAPDAADGLMALASGGTPQELLRKMADALGLTSQFDELQKKGLSDEEFRQQAIVLDISQMCRKFGAPESEIAAQSYSTIVDYMSTQMSSFIANKVGTKMINGLVLGPEIFAKLYNVPVPQVELVFQNVATDSMLADVLFKSDYRLKSICSFPDAREQVPGHLTSLGFIQKEAQASNYVTPADAGAEVGHTLIPGNVKMRVSPSGEVVEFQGSEVKVIGWLIKTTGNTNSTAADFITKTVPKYGDYLTQHYDNYAKVYPEWHKMTELTKIIALARWAKKNNYTIKVADASGTKMPHPKYVEGFWSAVFQVDGDKAALTVLAEGGASFAQDQGEEWVQVQPDVTVTSDVLKQLVASTVIAEQSVNAAIAGNMESARDLAEKSAEAMTGQIDLTKLPSLNDIPVPGNPAPYTQATMDTINEATDCMKKMDTAQKDLAHAQELASTSPDEAAKLKAQATQAQDEAQAKLKQILGNVSAYKTDPNRADDVVVAYHNNSVVTPTSGGTSMGANTSSTVSPTQGTSAAAATPKPEDWSTKCSQWTAELDQVNKQIDSTRNVLLKLSASIQSDGKLFAQWEKDASAGFDRSVTLAGNVILDASIGTLTDRYDTIYELAQKLPNKPADVIEKYRLLNSLAHRMKEAKETNDFGDLVAHENKTEAELYESLRDGVGQIIGLLELDKTVPGMVWKYVSLGCDAAYNLTELRQLWKNTATLEANNVRYAEAVKKLTARMQALIDRQKDLMHKIEAGESIEPVH